MSAFTRDDWNALIQRVNALDCINTRLAEVPVNHRWTKTDITTLRAKLTSICSNSPEFTVALNKWHQDVIGEIETAISACDCEGSCDPLQDNGLVFDLGTLGLVVGYDDYYKLATMSFDPAQVTGVYGSDGIAGRWVQILVTGRDSWLHMSHMTRDYSMRADGTVVGTTPSLLARGVWDQWNVQMTIIGGGACVDLIPVPLPGWEGYFYYTTTTGPTTTGVRDWVAGRGSDMVWYTETTTLTTVTKVTIGPNGYNTSYQCAQKGHRVRVYDSNTYGFTTVTNDWGSLDCV